MTKDHLGALWTAIGFVLVGYALAAWVGGQGGSFPTDKLLIDARPTCAQLIALIVCGFLFLLQAELGIRYARLSDAASWHGRAPVVATKVLHLQGLETASPEGMWYQRFWLFVFVVLPVAALVQFLLVVLDGGVSDRSDLSQPMTLLSGVPLERMCVGPYWNDAYRIGPRAAQAPEDLRQMVTWLPVVEPILIGLLLLAVLIQCVRLAKALLRGGAKPDRAYGDAPRPPLGTAADLSG